MQFALWLIMNKAWRAEATPQDWKDGIICPIWKDGDKRDPLNYRGITLLCVAAKVFCLILNQRLSSWCEENGKMSDEQGGFRKGRGCVDQIFVLKEALRLRKGKKTYACFVDIRKAYDRTWRNGLWQMLWNLGVRGRMWRVIQSLYSNTRAKVRLGTLIRVVTGLRQGCVLSPLLFDIFLDGLVRAQENSRGVESIGTVTTCSAYWPTEVAQGPAGTPRQMETTGKYGQNETGRVWIPRYL